MKYLIPLICLLAAASCSTVVTDDCCGTCQEPVIEWVDYGEDPMMDPEAQAAMEAAGTPGAQHEMLAAHAGKWVVEGKVWMDPEGDPMPMKAEAKIEVVLGGRYITEEFKSDFMGMPFEGRLMQGYDNVRQQYWSLWTDNMSTGYWLSHGTETSPGHIDY